MKAIDRHIALRHSLLMPPRTLTTRIATVVKVSDHLVEQHMHPGAVMDLAGLTEMVEARRALCPEGGCCVLAMVPHGVFSSPETGDENLFLADRGKTALKALAIVAEDEKVEAMTKVYLAFHPTPFPAKVFNDEAPARAWLRQLSEEPDASTTATSLGPVPIT